MVKKLKKKAAQGEGGVHVPASEMAKALHSIYAPFDPKAPRKTKKKLQWKDVSGSKLLEVHKYHAPWSGNKSNWWQRSPPMGATYSWRLTVRPGEVRKIDLDQALQQKLHLNVAMTNGGLGVEGLARAVLLPFEDLTPTTPCIIAAMQANTTRPLKLVITAGTYSVRNDGDMPMTLLGMIETLYIKMV